MTSEGNLLGYLPLFIFSSGFMHIHELGHVVLFVTDIKLSVSFYNGILGFPLIHQDKRTAVFSGGRTHHELLLIEIGGEPDTNRRPKPGLYHIGFKVGDSHEDILKVWEELNEKGVPIVGTGDHTVTHSIYILDPDGNELELYADVSDIWKTDPKAVMAPVKPLDLE